MSVYKEWSKRAKERDRVEHIAAREEELRQFIEDYLAEIKRVEIGRVTNPYLQMDQFLARRMTTYLEK